MNRLVARPVRTSRRGLSQIEVVVIILALLLLVSVIVPAILLPGVGGRPASLRLQCSNNLKQIALAAVNYATVHEGQLPLVSQRLPALKSEDKLLWPIHLLPYMDQAGAIEYIAQKQSPLAAREALSQVLSAKYPGLACPEDVNHFRQPGGLSYGANIGYGAWTGTPRGIETFYDFGAFDHSSSSIDWNNNVKPDEADKEIARATGVFWQESDDHHIKLDDMSNGDGMSQTILFAETITLPALHEAGLLKNGINPLALDGGIGVGYTALGIRKQNTPKLALDQMSVSREQFDRYFVPKANCLKTQVRSPAATSMHKESVNVVFADGHTKMLSKEIDPAVWAALHTPKGVRYGQRPLSESDYDR